MRHPGSGAYDRERMPKRLRRFSPAESLNSITEVDLQELRRDGKNLILLDVDNTLVAWRGEKPAPDVGKWLDQAKEMGFRFCIISNTRRPERLKRVAGNMGIPFVRSKFKPSTEMFLMALEMHKAKPEEAVMIGDQLLTDIFGANRSGIDAIWVKKIGDHEFVGTRHFSRNVERLVAWFLHKYFEPALAPAGKEAPRGLFHSQIVRQFVKFGVVGGTSFIIDYCVRMTFMYAITFNGVQMSTSLGSWLMTNLPSLFSWAENVEDAAVPFAAMAGASLALVNSFYWNRRWTFRIVGPDERGRQFRRFVLISVVGLGLNVVLTTIFNHILPLEHKNALRVATLLAVFFVAIWNFGGQKLYAFKQKEA